MRDLIITNNSDRAAYERCLQWLDEHTNQAGNMYVINQQDLLIEKLPTSQKQTLKFDIFKGNTNSDRANEIRLNRNDMFFVTHMALTLMKYDPVANKYGDYPAFTYPDAAYFGSVVGAVNEYESLMCVYNGQLGFKTGSMMRLENFHTSNFMVVPERVTPAATELPQWGPTHEQRGFYAMHPNFIIDGSAQNELQLELGQGLLDAIDGSAAVGDELNVIQLRLKGFVAREAAERALRYEEKTWF